MSAQSDDSSMTRQLLHGCRAGSPDGFERLFARHRIQLREFISRRLAPGISKRIDASDIVQDTHLTMVQRFERFMADNPMAFRTWAYKTALDCLGKARRQHILVQKRTVLQEVPLSDASSLYLANSFLGTPSEHFSTKEMIARVRQAIGQLSDDDRELLLMRYVDGLSNRDIADILDLSPDAVSKRHGRALIRLNRLL